MKKSNYIGLFMLFLAILGIILSVYENSISGDNRYYIHNLLLLILSIFFLLGFIWSLLSGKIYFRGILISKVDNREVYYFFVAIAFMLFCGFSTYLAMRL